MLKVLIAAVLFLLISASAWAQTSPGAAQRGAAKLWIGAGLLTAGAFVLPITKPSEGGRLVTGVGLMSAGGAVMLWGAHERRQPTRPQTGVTLVANKHGSALLIHRVW